MDAILSDGILDVRTARIAEVRGDFPSFGLCEIRNLRKESVAHLSRARFSQDRRNLHRLVKNGVIVNDAG